MTLFCFIPSLFAPIFRNLPTDSTLPPLPPFPSCHSPLLLHHPSSPSAGARFNKRRWECGFQFTSLQYHFINCFFKWFHATYLCVKWVHVILFSSVFCLLFHHFHLSPLGGLRARLHSSSSVPNFLKFQFLAPVQENDCPEPKNRYTYTQNHHIYMGVPSAPWIPSLV